MVFAYPRTSLFVTNFLKVENIQFKVYFIHVNKSKYSFNYINHKTHIHGFFNLIFFCCYMLHIFVNFTAQKKIVIPCCNCIALTKVKFFHDVVDRMNYTNLLCASVHWKPSVLENPISLVRHPQTWHESLKVVSRVRIVIPFFFISRLKNLT